MQTEIDKLSLSSCRICLELFTVVTDLSFPAMRTVFPWYLVSNAVAPVFGNTSRADISMAFVPTGDGSPQRRHLASVRLMWCRSDSGKPETSMLSPGFGRPPSRKHIRAI